MSEQAEVKCLYCGDELRLEELPGHLYAHGIEPPWEHLRQQQILRAKERDQL